MHACEIESDYMLTLERYHHCNNYRSFDHCNTSCNDSCNGVTRVNHCYNHRNKTYNGLVRAQRPASAPRGEFSARVRTAPIDLAGACIGPRRLPRSPLHVARSAHPLAVSVSVLSGRVDGRDQVAVLTSVQTMRVDLNELGLALMLRTRVVQV